MANGTYKSDIEIAQSAKMLPICEVAKQCGIDLDLIENYGKYKAKIDYAPVLEKGGEKGKLVLVTAITPTPAGEGKTTTTIGLADGLRRIGKNAMVALREPSLGPVFGVKGGAAGGGYAQVVPMEDINLHFTGDFHAIGAANNLLAAMLDNHIQQGNALGIDPRKITWKRCVDMNDRQLRFVVDGLGGKANGTPREDGFDITVASEVMAVLCLANSLADYAVTEAGFGADLGAEKFFDIKCRKANLTPDAVVVVATVRALKMHGGMQKQDLANENIEALEKGVPNLLRHVSNVKNVYKLPCVVAINRFPTDTDKEIDFIIAKCKELGVNTVLSTVWADGGKGGEALAKEVVRLCEQEKGDFSFAYEDSDSISQKIEKIVRKVYGGDGISVTSTAQKQIANLEKLGFSNLPVCIAKTQYSFSDDASLLGAPEHFTVNVKNVKVSAGAGFIVVLTGEIMTMPGLPKSPAAERIDVTDDGKIVGLF